MRVLHEQAAYASRDFEVAAFGYKSRFLLNFGIDIGRLAERLLTFIDAHAHENTNVFIVAHSLGGLVTRRFLVETFNQPSRRDFFRKIKQVHFIGVPHRGATVLLRGQRLLNRLPVRLQKLLTKPNPLAAELRWGSPLLLAILQAWGQVLKECLQEGIAPPAIFNYVGDKDSIAPLRSIIGDSNDQEHYRVVDGGHIDIAKPHNSANELYKIIKRKILEVASKHQRGLSMARELPEAFVERPAQLNQLLDDLFEREGEKPVGITAALCGPPGFGKTTLAVAFCYAYRVRTAFADGILWATLGQTPNIAQELSKLYAALTGERPNFVGEDDAAHHLAQKLKDKNCLIVIDDVWDRVHLQPFLRGGTGCSRLFTTRQFEIAGMGKLVKVDEMTMDEAVKMLTTALPPRLNATFKTLAKRLGKWPLLLKLVAATLKQRMELGEEIDQALAHVNAALDRRGVIAFDRENPSARDEAVAGTVEVSLAELRGAQRLRYIDLAILPEGVDIPLTTVGALWRMDEFNTEELLVRLNNCSLLDFNLRTRTVSLHAVISAYLKSQLSAPVRLHGQLLDTWDDLCHLPNAYAWRWIAYHLAQAERKDQLRRLILDPDWLHAKLEATDVSSLIADFDVLREDDALRLIKEALKLSAHILVREKTQIRTQLYGRLLPYEDGQIKRLLYQFRQQKSPWLRPVTPTLAVPGGQLLRTLTGHTDSVAAVSLLSQGRKAISASWDRTLRVWDLRSGVELFKLVC